MAKDSIGKKFEDQEPQCSMNYHFDPKSRDNYVPNLLKTAESRLLKISEIEDCSNRDFAVKINASSSSEQTEIRSDMEDWEAYMFCKEYYRRNDIVDYDLPPVRICNPIRKRFSSDITLRCRTEGCESTKADLNNYIQDIQQRLNFSDTEIRSHDDGWKEEMSEETAKQKYQQAIVEKVRGNAAFHEGNFKKACEHYSNCISLHCLKEAYNNRAQAIIKLSDFPSAIPDLEEVIKMDPSNEKALYRRAFCRRQMRMYHEAMRDAESILRFHPNTAVRNLLASIKADMSKLQGKSYRVRENFGSRSTFQIDISQLPVYAAHGNNYLLEADRTGCSKACACGFCNAEDLQNRIKSSSLRIKERHRWKQLTLELLREMQIPLSTPQVSNNLAVKCDDATKTATSPKLINGVVKNENAAMRKPKEANNRAPKKAAIQNKSACETASSLNSKKLSKDAATTGRADIESLINNISLTSESVNGIESTAKRENLRTVQPSTLRKKYGSDGRELTENSLASMIQSLCNDFSLEKEWNLVSQYLQVIASLERFKIVVEFLDKKPREDLEKLMNNAISLGLENAEKLKTSYFSTSWA